MANSVAQNLNDKDWVEELYLKALEKEKIMKYNILISGQRQAEIALGFIESEENLEFYRENSEDDDEFYNCDDIIHTTNAFFDPSEMNLRITDKNGEEEFYDDIALSYFSFETPSIKDALNHREAFGISLNDREVFGVYGGYFYFTGGSDITVECDDFNPNYLRIITKTMDELPFDLGDYMISDAFYISDEDFIRIYNDFTGEELELDEDGLTPEVFFDCIDGIISKDEFYSLFANFKCEVQDGGGDCKHTETYFAELSEFDGGSQKIINKILENIKDKELVEKLYQEVLEQNYHPFFFQCMKLASIAKEKLNDKELMKKSYKKALTKAWTFAQCTDLANEVIQNLNDKEFTIEIYKKAQGSWSFQDSRDYISLANLVIENLNDKIWAKELYKKAQERIVNFKDYENLVNSINKNFNDESWIFEIYKTAHKKIAYPRYLIQLAYSINENFNDKTYVKEICKKAEQNIINSSSDFINLANFIAQNLDDKVWAKEIYLKAAEKVKNSRDFRNFRDLADSVIQNLNDKDLARKLYKKAEEKAKKSWEFRDLAESVAQNLKDEIFTKELYLKAEEKAKDSSDFRFLADSVEKNLNDKTWAEELRKKVKKY